MTNWTSIGESVGSVAVIVLPTAVAHYKKLGTVLDALTKILDGLNTAENRYQEKCKGSGGPPNGT